jgi:hypothetical protein
MGSSIYKHNFLVNTEITSMKLASIMHSQKNPSLYNKYYVTLKVHHQR